MRFLEGVTREYGGVARVRGKKATHSYAALSFLSVQNTYRQREDAAKLRQLTR